MGGLKFRTNGGLVRTTGGGVSFGCKARHEGDIYVSSLNFGTAFGTDPNLTNNIAQIKEDGSLDTGFNTASNTIDNNTIYTIAMQSDGKVIIGGSFTSYNGTSVGFCCRLNSDGSLDTSFNSGGAGANSVIYSIAIQSDGKILVGGQQTTFNGTSVGRICRLNSDGSLDTSFNSGGAGSNNTVQSIVLQSDGKILIGGSFTSYNQTTTGNVCRLNSNGSLDTNFNSQGSGATGFVADMVVQSDGKILLGFGNSLSFSFSSSYNGTSLGQICRLNSDGTLDTNFNSGGTGADTYSAISRIVLQSDGKIIICIGGYYSSYFGGPKYNGTSVQQLIRLNSDGSLDTSFNSGGAGPNTTVDSIALQSDGKILASGNNQYNGTKVTGLYRLNSDGSLDTGFNSGGYGPGPGYTINSLFVKTDGKILIGGRFGFYNFKNTTSAHAGLQKFSAKFLSLDPDYNPGSVAEGFSGRVYSICVLPDDKKLIGGYLTLYNGIALQNFLALNSDGSLDTNFNSGGAGPNSQVWSIALQSDGKILIGGPFTTYNGTSVGRICRLNSDGSLDTSFNSGGAGSNNHVQSIVLQSDGKILVGGNFTTYNGTSVGRICRLNSDGSLDTGFNSGGSGVNNQINTTLPTDGKILVCGFFTTYNGTNVGRICRLNSDGSLDTSFNSGGAGSNNVLYSIVVQSDGKIVIGGGCTSYNGTSVGFCCGLNSDGSLDTSFNTGGAGFNSYIYKLAVQSDGKILVGGQQNTFNGVASYRLTKLNSDGTLFLERNDIGYGTSDQVQDIFIV